MNGVNIVFDLWFALALFMGFLALTLGGFYLRLEGMVGEAP